MHFADLGKHGQSCATIIPLNPPISSAAITSFTNVHSGITVNMYVIMQTDRNYNSGSTRQVFTKIHNKVKEISYSEDMELRNH